MNGKSVYAMDWGEWKLVLGRWAFVLFLTCVPYIFGLLIAPPDMQYMGYVYNPDEPNIHLSWMMQAARGRILFDDRFTAEPQRGLFFNLFFLILGNFARVVHLPLVWAFHLARLFFGFLLLLIFYLFVSFVTTDKRVRQTAFLFIALSSGLGWFFWLLGRWGFPTLQPVDFSPGLMMPEAITFLSIHLNPLFCFSICLLILTFWFMMMAFETGRIKYAILAGISGLILGNVHSYDMFVVWWVLLIYTVLISVLGKGGLKRNFGFYMILILISVPSMVYQYYVFKNDPIFRAKAITPTLSPHLLEMFASYGIVLILALPGIYRVIKRRKDYLFFVVWCMAGFLLIYFPFNRELAKELIPFQRKMAEGLHIPICVLAAVGWAEVITPYMRKKVRTQSKMWTIAAVAFVFFTMWSIILSNFFFIFFDNIPNLATNNQNKLKYLMPPFYLHRQEVEAMKWLKVKADLDEVVLSSPFIGSYIPTISGNKVFIGHWAETINYSIKLRQLRSFFKSGKEDEIFMKNFLRQNYIKYFYFGPYERNLCRFKPGQFSFLVPCFSNDEVIIYQVRF